MNLFNRLISSFLLTTILTLAIVIPIPLNAIYVDDNRWAPSVPITPLKGQGFTQRPFANGSTIW